jgi:HSP20 family protein
MARQRDPFANFDRMRREMDDLFGAVWQRPTLASRRGRGFSPHVDVYYCGDPPKAIVKADLSGIDLSDVSLEVSGRELVISGERAMQETEGRVYQQVEIDSGPFRRVIELGADVEAEDSSATYQDGVLRVELPLAEPEERTRRVPIERSDSEEQQGDG